MVMVMVHFVIMVVVMGLVVAVSARLVMRMVMLVVTACRIMSIGVHGASSRQGFKGLLGPRPGETLRQHKILPQTSTGWPGYGQRDVCN